MTEKADKLCWYTRRATGAAGRTAERDGGLGRELCKMRFTVQLGAKKWIDLTVRETGPRILCALSVSQVVFFLQSRSFKGCVKKCTRSTINYTVRIVLLNTLYEVYLYTSRKPKTTHFLL